MPEPPRWQVLAAFAVIYLVWGSTYLAIAVAVEALPPLAMAGTRFVVAGWVLFLWGMARSRQWPSTRDWGIAFAVGGLMLTLGNGILSLVETRMPSGLAALLVATVPLWVVFLEAVRDRRVPGPAIWAGGAAGIAGVGILAGVDAGWEGGSDPYFVAALLAGAFAWAWGSLLSRRANHPSLRVRAGMQMLAGGVLLWLAEVAVGGSGEARVTPPGLVALGYLVVFGSILAFTSYTWLLRVAPPTAVSTYAFVNPVVAVVLGVWFLHEPLTLRTGLGAALVVGAVVLINRSVARRVAASSSSSANARRGTK